MDSPKQIFQKTFSIPQQIFELENYSSNELRIQQSKGSIKSPTKFGNKYSTLLTTWFDFAYFCCISPFRFNSGIRPKNGLDIVRNKLQNVICGIGHFSTLVLYLGDIRRISPSGKNPVFYLDFFMVHATLTRHFLLVWILWRKSHLFKEIVDTLNMRRPLIRKYGSPMYGTIKNNEHIPKKWLANLILSVYFFFAICTVVVQPIITMSQSQSARLGELEEIEDNFKFTYFLSPKKSITNENVSETHSRPILLSLQAGIVGPIFNESTGAIENEFNSSDMSEEESIQRQFEKANAHISPRAAKRRRKVVEGVSYTPNYPLVAISMIGMIVRYLFGCCADCLILLIVLSLWFPVTDFAKFLRTFGTDNGNNFRNPFSTLDALAEYRDLKKLSILINASIKHLLIFVVLQAIFFYPVGVKQVVASCEYTAIHYIGFFLVSFCLTFHFAADICKQMQSFQTYLRDTESRWELSKLDLYMLLQETTTNPVGIADEGRFVIDYPFVHTITGTLMTYLLVSVQYDQCPASR